MSKFLWSLIFLINLVSNGQQSKLDSLEIELSNSKNQNQKVKLLNSYIQIAFENDIKRGLSFADSLLYYAKLENSFKEISAAHRYKANYYMYKGEYSKALKNFKNSLQVNSSNNYINGLYADNASMGNVHFYSRKYDSAKVKYNDALKIVLDNKIKNKYTSAYMSLANVNYNSKNNEKAIEYYIKAIDSSIYLEGNERKRVVPVFVNLGTLFLDRKDYKKSDLYLNQGYSLAKELNFKQGIADAGLKLSRSYFENNSKLKESEEILLNCIQIYKDLGDNPYLVNTYINLGNLYLITNELDKSINVKKKAVDLAEKEKLVDYYYASATSLAKSYFKNGNYNESLKYANEVIKDTSDARMAVLTKLSLFELKTDLAAENSNYKLALAFSQILKNETEKQFKAEKNEIVNDIQEKYETEKKEKENLLLEQKNTAQELQLAKENKRKWFFGIGLIASLIALIIFTYFYKKNKKQKRIIENLQRELHHRVKNNLAIIDALIDDIKDEFDSDTFKNKLTDLQNRINSINEVHQQLYASNEVTSIHVKKYIEKLALNVQHSFPDNNITIKQNIDDSLKLDTNKSFPVGLIINEFITNSYKHAFDESMDGIVSIDMKEDSQVYSLSLSDNGKGLSSDFDFSKLDSFGIDVMQLLSKQLKGTFSLDGTNGVKLNIEFPKI